MNQLESSRIPVGISRGGEVDHILPAHIAGVADDRDLDRTAHGRLYRIVGHGVHLAGVVRAGTVHRQRKNRVGQ